MLRPPAHHRKTVKKYIPPRGVADILPHTDEVSWSPTEQAPKIKTQVYYKDPLLSLSGERCGLKLNLF